MSGYVVETKILTEMVWAADRLWDVWEGEFVWWKRPMVCSWVWIQVLFLLL